MTGNYCAFFRLLRGAPRMGPYVVDAAVPRMRAAGLAAMAAAYRPSVPCRFVASQLGLEGGEREAAELATASGLGVAVAGPGAGELQLQLAIGPGPGPGPGGPGPLGMGALQLPRRPNPGTGTRSAGNPVKLELKRPRA